MPKIHKRRSTWRAMRIASEVLQARGRHRGIRAPFCKKGVSDMHYDMPSVT